MVYTPGTRVRSEVPGQLRLGEKIWADFQNPSFSTGVSKVTRQGVGNNPSTMLIGILMQFKYKIDYS